MALRVNRCENVCTVADKKPAHDLEKASAGLCSHGLTEDIAAMGWAHKYNWVLQIWRCR